MLKNWDSEAIREFQHFKDIVDAGYLVNGTNLTNLYNKIFEVKVRPTSCGSCLRSRYNALLIEFRKFNAEVEKQEAEEEKITEEKPVVKHRGRPKKGESNEHTK